MKNKMGNLILGIVIICVGLLYAVSMFGWLNFSFDGWWTLFVIIPFLANIISFGPRIFNCTGLGVGVLMLLDEQNIIHNGMGFKLIFPLIIVAFGLSLLFKKSSYNEQNIDFKFSDVNDKKDFYAIFSGNSPQFGGQNFYGCNTTAIFGGMKLQLGNALINNNCVVNVYSIFGGTEIHLPSNVKVTINSASVFGGVDNKFVSASNLNAPTVLINATCIFGGIDIK